MQLIHTIADMEGTTRESYCLMVDKVIMRQGHWLG